MNHSTRPTRKTVITNLSILKESYFTESKSSGFSRLAKGSGIDPENAVFVMVSTQTGTLPEQINFFSFGSMSEANQFAAAHPIGETVSSGNYPPNDEVIFSQAFAKLENKDLLSKMLTGAGDEGSGLPFFTLKEAGLGDGYHTEKIISDIIGVERMNELRKLYPENWSVAAKFEYCISNYPKSSPVYIAAQYDYAYYVQNDDFAAGYLLRDLEVVTAGVEEAVVRASEFSKRQSIMAIKGGEAQAAKAAKRKNEFFRLALNNLSKWVWRSEKEQVRIIKELVFQNDPEALFVHGNNPLSNDWFDNALAELRSSGELERATK